MTKSCYKGWYISKDLFNKDAFQAVKGKEWITGTIEQIKYEIDKRLLEEMKTK